MTRAACLACLLALAGATPALAQSNADKARLDEFATPAASDSVQVGQIATTKDTLETGQTIDRTIVSPLSAPQSRSEIAQQVNASADRQPIGQVAPLGDRNARSAPALSRREEGRPIPSAPLGGADRCDPQAGTEKEMAICQRILELRAREFSATEAPRLSPEQELLAREAHSERVSLADLAGRSGASRSLDAEERAAQELGFLALPSPSTPPVEEEETSDTSLSEAVKGILVQMGVPNP